MQPQLEYMFIEIWKLTIVVKAAGVGAYKKDKDRIQGKGRLCRFRGQNVLNSLPC